MSYIPIAIAAGASIAGGMLASNNSQSNADSVQASALFNYMSQIQAGQQTAAMQASLAQYNANLAIAQGEINAAATKNIADYNSSLIAQTALYNDGLMAAEAEAEWSKYELDSLYMKNDFIRVQGATIATQGASGTLIGTGSNEDAVIDNAAQHELDQTVLRFNADTVATNYLNARAKGEYEATLQRQKLTYEADQSAIAGKASAYYTAQGVMAQGQLDSQLTLMNSTAASMSQYSGSMARSNQYSDNANQQFYGSLLSGISTAASMYYS